MNSICLRDVSVLDISSINLDKSFALLKHSIDEASFIALDLELSGIGERQKLNQKSVENRYEAIRFAAESRSILSIGISCFKNERVTDSCLQYCVSNFNIATLSSCPYTVEPDALKFLVSHGFDFNHQYRNGIPYSPGPDSKISPSPIRELMNLLLLSKKPLVFHNAWMDLMFLYQGLYTNLPADLNTFCSDLSEMFPAGLYDTKYIAEFVARFPASFLEYIFRKCQSINNFWTNTSLSPSPRCVSVRFPAYFTAEKWGYLDFVVTQCYSEGKESNSKPDRRACLSFASHGHCLEGKTCRRSHDIDVVLRQEGRIFPKEVLESACLKIPGEVFSVLSDKEVDELSDDQSEESFMNELQQQKEKLGCHRAGFDAFMTAYSMAIFMSAFAGDLDDPKKNFKNKICLSGKNFPLNITKTSFSKTSKNHQERYNKLLDSRCT